jgi:hypothetical protein
MASTMKKEAKAKAVKKGTFYECGWCGKEGTDAPYDSFVKRTVCGRSVLDRIERFCSLNCMKVDVVESNRRMALEQIEEMNRITESYRKVVVESVEDGTKIDHAFTQIAKLANIYKKVLTLRVSGDRLGALKLYTDKKATITDCIEDVLADKLYSFWYMDWVDRFSRVEGILDETCGF